MSAPALPPPRRPSSSSHLPPPLHPPSRLRSRSKLDKALLTAIVLLVANLFGTASSKWDSSTMSRDITDIRERVARIEATLEVKHEQQEQYGYLDRQ